MITHIKKELSIQINLSGLSFCVLNRSENTIELLKVVNLDRKMTPFELLDELKARFEEHSITNQNFESVCCIYKNELSTLVPEMLFNEEHLADYLKFNAKILKSDFLNYDKLQSSKSVNVYVPLVNVNNYLFDSFGGFTYKHASTILIDTVLPLSAEDSEQVLFVHVNQHHFEMVLYDGQRLVFYNTFEYGSKEDFIYYILFTVEQLQLDPEVIDAKFLGMIDEKSELFEMVYTYLRHVEVINNHKTYDFSDSVSEEAKKQSFILLNSFEA